MGWLCATNGQLNAIHIDSTWRKSILHWSQCTGRELRVHRSTGLKMMERSDAAADPFTRVHRSDYCATSSVVVRLLLDQYWISRSWHPLVLIVHWDASGCDSALSRENGWVDWRSTLNTLWLLVVSAAVVTEGLPPVPSRLILACLKLAKLVHSAFTCLWRDLKCRIKN